MISSAVTGPLWPTYYSVDPGSIHCGWAEWIQLDDGKWECREATEYTKPQCEDELLDIYPGTLTGVAIEGFWLRPDLARQQVGSTFGEVEVIGVARAACRRLEIPLLVVTPGDRDAARTRLRAVGYKFKAHGSGGHAADAESVLVSALRLSVRDLVAVPVPKA